MIINGIKLNDVKVDKSEKTELSERDNKIIGWVSLALATLLLIAFFLGGFFSPVKASAGELVEQADIDSVYENYIVLKFSDSKYSVFVNCDNFNYSGSDVKYSGYFIGYFSDLDSVRKSLTSSRSLSGYSTYTNGIDYFLYADFDLSDSSGNVFFMKTPCKVELPTVVGGLQAPEIATALTSQIVGLVPLVLGLLVLAIGLWKGLKHLRQTLSRA